METLTSSTYYQDTARVSKSQLDALNRSPLHYWHRYINPDYQPQITPALTFGKLFHTQLLTPDQFETNYIVNDADKRTSAYKDAKRHADAAWLTIVSGDDLLQVQTMIDSIKNHPLASKLLAMAGEAEKIIEWTSGQTLCKSMIDKYIPGLNLVIDFKTTDDASPSGFLRSVKKYRYHVQGAFYSDAVKSLTGTAPDFILIAVEKSEPHPVAVYHLNPDAIEQGRAEYLANLQTLQTCRETNNWPSYSNELLTLNF